MRGKEVTVKGPVRRGRKGQEGTGRASVENGQEGQETER